MVAWQRSHRAPLRELRARGRVRARAQERAPAWRWESGAPEALSLEERARFAPATHWLYEWRAYWLRAPEADSLRVGAQRVAPELPGLFRVFLRNQLGLAEIVPERGGVALGPPLVAEVLSPKFPTLEAHHSFLSALLAALARDARRSPFATNAHAPTRFRLERSDDPGGPDARAAVELLVRHAGALTGALTSLRARPDERARHEQSYVPTGQVRFVEPAGLIASLSDPRALPGHHARRTGRWIPGRVRVESAWPSADTLANRAAATLVRLVRALCDALLARATLDDSERAVLRALASSCARALASAPLDAHANGLMPDALPHFPPASQRLEGYRALAALRDELEATHTASVNPSLDRACAARDVASLYEHWVFFALARSIERATGCAPVALRAPSTHDARGPRPGAALSFGDAGVLHYNPRVRSYSGPQKPDFLFCRAGRPVLALDAKFRLELDDFERARARREDIDRMHAYRDSLGVRAAACVYPGDRSVFHPVDARGALCGAFTLEALLARGAGVGALAMHPARPEDVERAQ